MPILFQLANGAIVKTMSAKELVGIPVWQNNRIIDHGHVSEIQRDVKQVRMLDHNYHIGILKEEDAGGYLVEQRYIVDGQHRHQVLLQHFRNELCAADFDVLVYECRFETEGELIEYFNAINKVKPVDQWKDDILILNNYVQAMDEVFRSRRTIYLRDARCHRPYLSTDRLRDALREHLSVLPATAQGAKDFAEKAKAWNDAAMKNETFVLGIRATKKRDFFEKGAKIGFVLAYDDKFGWIKECL
jgi:hypothetical protein